MANRITLPDGSVAVFEDHLSAEEIDARVKSHAELAAIGVSRSPRALPLPVVPRLPMATPKYAKSDWEPPPPRRELTAGQAYVERKAASQRAAFARVYGKHLGRR